MKKKYLIPIAIDVWLNPGEIGLIICQINSDLSLTHD